LGAKPEATSILAVLFMQVTFVMFALIVPLLTMVALIILWASPLTLQEQLTLEFITECLSAWEALAVFCFSLVAAVLQINPLAQYIANSATGNLCAQLELWDPLRKLFPTDPSQAKCFDVTATIQTQGILLLVAAAVAIMVEAVAFRLIRAAIFDRELAMRRHPPESPGDMTGFAGFLVRATLEPFGQAQVGNASSNAGMAQMYAQQQGVYGQGGNPIMSRELAAQPMGMQSPNPMFSGPPIPAKSGKVTNTHSSIDV